MDHLILVVLDVSKSLKWEERENFAMIGSWLNHLLDQKKNSWWSNHTPHPPPGHLIESLLLLESRADPKDRFQRRWQWQVLEMMMQESGTIPNLPAFVESLVVEADPASIYWEEIEGLCVQVQTLGYFGVWGRMSEVFADTNSEVYKRMVNMEVAIYVDTFEPEVPSKDCIIQ
jgi:hypothetical protein